jgi:DNA gyrase subunit A
VTLRTIKDRITDAVDAGNIKGIDDMRDESGRASLVRLVIELKKDANIDVVTNQLWEYTPLQTNLHALHIVLVNRVPKTLGLKQLLQAFLDHRCEVIRRRTQFLLRKARQRAHILEGLILAVADIDEIIRIIKTSPDVDAARQRLCAKALRLSEEATVRKLLPEQFVDRCTENDQHMTHTQADAILAMQLRKLTGLEIEQLAREYSKLTEEIADHEMILADHKLVLDIIAEDMRELKEKYGEPRRTKIEGAIGDIDMDALIAQEDVIVTISHQGYTKRVPMATYRSQGRGGKGIRGTDNKDEDFIEHLRVANTHDFMLFFTNRGRVYWLRVYDIPTMARTARGRALANLITMQAGERHVAVLPVSRFEEMYVFFCTEKGVVKKTPLSAFSNPRPSGIQAVTLDPDDSLIGVQLTDGKQEVVIGTHGGMACRFNEDDVRPMGRSARGVWGIDLAPGDKVVDLVAITPGMSLLTVCEKGMGKKTEIEEYRLTRRGAKGVINVRVTDKNGPVVALRAVTPEDSLMLITQKGILLRTTVDQLRDIGRATQGVRLIRVEDDDRVVAVAKVISEKDENGGDNGSPSPDAAPAAGESDPGPAEPK